MAKEWINPKYADLVKSFDDSGLPFKDVNDMANCSNCGGTGKIIYVDPSDGKMKDLSCGRCGGSGQLPD